MDNKTEVTSTGTVPVKTLDEVFAENKMDTVSNEYRKILTAGSIGDISSSMTNMFLGINHRQKSGTISINRDTYGLTLFSRPTLNLSDGNLKGNRNMIKLLNPNPNSYGRAIRVCLDYELNARGINTDLFDNQSAFITILTNTLVSMSGWPDMSLPVHSSKSGLFKEEWAFPDGHVRIDYSFDLSCNFQNMEGDPVNFLMQTWIEYMSATFMGNMAPYPKYAINNRYDAYTGIWRLVLDETKTKIQKIARTGLGAFPINTRSGSSFDFDLDKPLNQSNDEVSYSFKAIGACYNDEMLYREFNLLGEFFNDHLRPNAKDKFYAKVPMEYIQYFNWKGYPLINEDTIELEWWVPKEDLLNVTKSYSTNKGAKN